VINIFYFHVRFLPLDTLSVYEYAVYGKLFLTMGGCSMNDKPDPLIKGLHDKVVIAEQRAEQRTRHAESGQMSDPCVNTKSISSVAGDATREIGEIARPAYKGLSELRREFKTAQLGLRREIVQKIMRGLSLPPEIQYHPRTVAFKRAWMAYRERLIHS